MPVCYKIQFDNGDDDVEWAGSRGFYYELPDGSQIDLHPTIAWCCSCGCFVDAEWLPTLEDVQNDLEQLQDPASPRALVYTSQEPPFDESPFLERRAKMYAQAKVNAVRTIRWRRERISPPKCLVCGSTDIRFPDDDGTVEIPGRGVARISWHGMCSTDFHNWFYTSEGIRIPRDTKPTYWSLPDEHG